jgi:glycosyl transferase family 25
MNIEDTKVWVISLQDAALRREKFRRMASIDVSWEFWDAHRGAAEGLTYASDQVPGNYGRPLQTAELGCYSSHFSLWKWLLSSTHEQMVVLEDDVVADWNFVNLLRRTDFMSLGVEYLRLFAKMPAPWRFVASPFLERYRHLVRFTGYPLGTQAYLLTKAGAQKLVAHGSNIVAPVDVYMDRSWDHHLMNLAIWPSPVFESFAASHIGDDRLEPHRLRMTGSYVRNFMSKVRRKLLYARSIHGPVPSEESRLATSLRHRQMDH